MRRACLLLLLPLAACGFGSPAAGDGDGMASDGCDLGATWEQGKQPARTVHVSTTPGPGTPDGSPLNPFTSISDALDALEPGTRILLGPGDHDGLTITDQRGTADAPIWFEGPDSGPPARITGNDEGLHLIGAQYWVIRNLQVAQVVDQPGINLDDGSGRGDAHHIVLDRVTVASVNRACLQLTGVDDVVIRDSVLGACNRGVMMVGVHRAAIARTTIGAMVTAGVAMAGGSTDIEVRQNVIEHVDDGSAVWIGGDSERDQFRPALSMTTDNAEARDIRVFDNVVRDVRIAIKCSNCRGSLVAHNLLRRVTAYVLELNQPYQSIDQFQFAPAGDVRLVNNAIEASSTASALLDGGNGTAPASCTFSHNMWARDGGSWAPTLPAPETMSIRDTKSGYSDAGALCASTNSPAAGAGTPLPEVRGTLQGACRPSPPSIGPGEPDPGC